MMAMSNELVLRKNLFFCHTVYAISKDILIIDEIKYDCELSNNIKTADLLTSN